MTYGETFQDKTVIENYLISNVSFLSEFREYLKERAQLEKNYAKDSSNLIQKYAQKFEKKRGQSICISPNAPSPFTTSPSSADALGTVTEGSVSSDNTPQTPSAPSDFNNKDYYTYVNAWRSILGQMENINKARNRFSAKLTEIIIDKMKIQIGIKDEERKRNMLYHKNFNNEVEKLNIEKNNAKKKYYESCDSMMNHKKKLNKQDSSLNDNEKSNDKGLKKIEKLIDNTQVEMDNKKNLYILSLTALNKLKRKVNSEYIPEIYNILQTSQESIIKAFQIYCQDYIKLEQDLTEDMKNSFNNALTDINAIDPVSDNVLFEKEKKEDISPIEDEKYVGVINDDSGDYIITNKSSIYLSNLNASLKSQLAAYQEKYNAVKSEYDQFQTAYQDYLNDPSKTDCESMKDKQSELWYNLHMAEIPIIVNEAKIEAITNNVGEDVQENSHTFKTVMFLNSTVCDFCQEKIRGKALQCKSCSFVCHSKCESEVPQFCTGTKMDRKTLRVANDSSSGHNRSLSTTSNSTDNTDYNSPIPISLSVVSDYPSVINENESGLVEEPNSSTSEQKDLPVLPTGVMCAIFEYQPQNDDEVALSINDRVEIIEPETDGWVKVKTDHGEGFVPSSYIAPIKKAIYEFHPEKDDEISLKEGDSVVVLNQEDAGWLKIKKGSLEGIVPESYIDM